MIFSKSAHSNYDRLVHFFERFRFNEHTTMLFLATILGILGGFGAVGFRSLISIIQHLLLGDSKSILQAVIALAWYKKLLYPLVGGLIIGPLIYYFGRETKGHGVPEVMEAVALKGGIIRSRVMVLKAFVSAITISVGGSVGREGPIVQIGSSLGSSIGQLLKVNKQQMRVLVAAGAAAGIAATFNAPIAGVLFAIEIILGNYAIHTLLPLIMASVMATAVGRWYFGDYPAFKIPHYELGSFLELGPYLLLGVICGVMAVVFIKLLYKMEDVVEASPLKGWSATPIVFLFVGLITLVFPQVYGVGYDTIGEVLEGNMAWTLLLLLIPAKLFATSLTLGAGGSGGIFAPSLYIGAVTGGLLGTIVHSLVPQFAHQPGAFAVVGMSALVAGATQAPVTAFMIIFELTNDYKLILPLMICSIIASFVAAALKRESIYTLKLSRRGVDLSQGMEVSIMQATKVRDVLDNDMVIFQEHTTFRKILEVVLQENRSSYYVVNHQSHFLGTFSLHDVKEVMNEVTLADLVVAQDLVPKTVSPYVNVNDNLADCMRKFSIYEFEELPVVQGNGVLKLMGRVTRRQIINIYNREILRQGATGLKFIQAKLPLSAPTQSYVDLPEGYEINMVPVTKEFEGKSLQDLDLRKRYNVSVVAINRLTAEGKREVIIPQSDDRLLSDETMIIIGRSKDIETFKKTHYNRS